MTFVRGVLGIVIGFAIFFGVARFMTGSGLWLSVAWTVAAGVVAGYLAALIAGGHEFPHAAAVGMLMIGMSFLSMRAEGAPRPGWYQITIGGCGPISALIGAAIRLLSKPRQRANANISAPAMRR